MGRTARSEGRPPPTFRDLAPPLGVQVASVLPVFAMASLATEIRADLDIGADQLGVAVAVFFGAGSIMSVVMAMVGERLGGGRSLRWSGLLASGLMAALALFARSWGVLLAGMAMAGGLQAVVDPATNLHLVRSIAPRRLGLAIGIKQSAVPVATIVAGLAIPVIAVPLGWRWTFIAFAVLALPTAVCSPVLQRNPRPDAAQSRRAGDVPVVSLLLLSIGIGAASAGAVTLVGFSVDSAVHFGLSPTSAGLLAALGGVLGLLVRVQSGRWADRKPGQYLDVVAIMLGSGMLVFLALATGSRPLIALATPLGYATAWGWPVLLHLSVLRTNQTAPASATAIVMSGAYFGGVAGPLLFGWLAEDYSYRTAWLGTSSWAAVGCATIALGHRLIGGHRGEVDTEHAGHSAS